MRKGPSDQLTDWLYGQEKNGEKREKRKEVVFVLFFGC